MFFNLSKYYKLFVGVLKRSTREKIKKKIENKQTKNKTEVHESPEWSIQRFI